MGIFYDMPEVEPEPETALRVVPIWERMRARASETLRQLVARETTEAVDVVAIGGVLPVEPTDLQFGDFAFRMSMAAEDLLQVLGQHGSAMPSCLAPAMGIPILDRRELQMIGDEVYSITPRPQVKGREMLCVVYVSIPTWRGWERAGMVAKLNEVAKRHGIWCGDANLGAIPSLEDQP